MSQTDAFKVCVRIRPLNQREQELQSNQRRHINFKELNNHETICYIDCPSQSVLALDGQVDQKQFVFDNVFGESQTTHDLYNEQIQAMLAESISQGYNATIFAYGMTGAGKSFTMFGELIDGEFATQQKGIISLCVEQIFKDPTVQRVGMSFLEIYNEQLRDLICETQAGQLLIVDDPSKGGVVVQDVQEITVESNEQVRQLVYNGHQRRVMAATQANMVSSRSHAILQFFIVSEKYTTKLSLVDLAGSERASVSENKGIRLQEGANINKSLLALGNCINVLAEQSKTNKKAVFVPYRDSKLTRLLKDSLGGNTRTVMIGCVSPSVHCHEETINTLKYASRARAIKKRIQQNIKTGPDYNEVGLVLGLQQEILRLQTYIGQLKENQSVQTPVQRQDSVSIQFPKEIVSRLILNLEEKIELKSNMRDLEELQRSNNEELMKQISMFRRLEDILEGQEENFESPICEESIRQELERTRSDIQEYQRQIDENELIRMSLDERIRINHQEKIQLENGLRQPAEDQRDQIIRALQCEIADMRSKMAEKDELIDRLKQPQLTTTTTNATLEHDLTQRSMFQRSRQQDEFVDKPFFTTSVQQACHEISLESACQSRVILSDIAEEPQLTETQGLGSSVVVPHPTIRESRKASCTSQVYPQTHKHANHYEAQQRQAMSARKGNDDNQRITLVQLNQARENYKAFRTRLHQLKEQIEMCVQNNINLNPQQVDQIVNLMTDLAENKYIISQQDHAVITMFQHIAEKFQQSRSNIFNQPVRVGASSRSKSATIARKKDSCSRASKPFNRKPLPNPSEVSPRANSKRMGQQQGVMSNANRNYAQFVSRAKKQSVTPGISQLLQMQGVPRRNNENVNIFIQKPPAKKTTSRNTPSMATSTISPMYKQQQTSFSSIQDENIDIPKHYQRQIFSQEEQFKSYCSKPPLVQHYLNMAQFSAD